MKTTFNVSTVNWGRRPRTEQTVPSNAADSPEAALPTGHSKAGQAALFHLRILR